MKKIAALTTIMLVCGVFTEVISQNYSGVSFAEAQANGGGEVTVLYLEEDAFAYYDENGNLTGIHIDIFEHFTTWLRNSKNINLTINYVGESESFARFYRSVQNGENGVFGLGTTTILERRRSEVQFSPPYINNIAMLVTHSDVPEISSMDEISDAFVGLKGVNLVGTTQEARILAVRDQYLPGGELVIADAQLEALDIIISAPEYYGYLDLSTYWPALQHGRPIRRHAPGDQAAEVFGYIMPVESDWAPVMHEFFSLGSGYRATTSYRNILVRHLGVEVTRMLEMARRQGNNNN